MTQPTIELIPLRNAVSHETATTLDLLIRITSPQTAEISDRPPLNIGLVIDRSGSMRGAKLRYARQAACCAIEQLLPTDRVSVVSYDNQVETLVSNTLVENKAQILNKIKTLTPGNTTALHQGWLEGSTQVSQHIQSEALNRVLLLSDGLANVGETNPDVIASDVMGLAQHGISTSTLGVGDDYNEDLMEAMANSGDGNYYYIEHPQELEAIFETELHGLAATIGQKVTLNVTPQTGVVVEEVFNDLETTASGEYQLPNLVVGNPINLVMRLKVPPLETSQSLCEISLSWNDREQSQRQQQTASLKLPVVSKEELENYPFNSEVRQLVAQLQVARAKEEAIQCFDQGDYAETHQLLESTSEFCLEQEPEVAQSPEMEEEIENLRKLKSDLSTGKMKKFRKKSSYQSYNSRRSKKPK